MLWMISDPSDNVRLVGLMVASKLHKCPIKSADAALQAIRILAVDSKIRWETPVYERA
jgi:hypothetical protein